MIAKFGDSSIGKTVRISVDFKIGDSRPTFFYGKTDGNTDINKVYAYIEASLLQLKRASVRESEGVWTDFEFESQPEPKSESSQIHQTEEVDGNGIIAEGDVESSDSTNGAESEATVNSDGSVLESGALENHGDSNELLEGASMQQSGLQEVIKIGKTSLDFEETAAALLPLGYQYIDGIGAFVKKAA